MQYAPVVIPTLCRADKFKRLMESLKRNKGAANTEVFIYLDFPKKSSHEEGYHEICEYLENIDGFKKVTIIKRSQNYGARENTEAAILDILTKFDRYIFTEDDNEFAPNFLDFMNKGLEKFKDDPKVFAINGYKHFYNIKYSDNNYFFQDVDFSAWGYAFWRDKCLKATADIQGYYFREALFNPFKLYRVARNGWNHVLSLIYSSVYRYNGKTAPDGLWSLYCAIEKKVIAMPVISKVRNHGMDDSGATFEALGRLNLNLSDQFEKQEIDQALSFDFEGDGYNYFIDNRRIFKREGYEQFGFGEFLKRIFRQIIKMIKNNLFMVEQVLTKKKARSSNIELFRIFLMLMIIAHHYTTSSGLNSFAFNNSEAISFYSFFFFFLGGGGR